MNFEEDLGAIAYQGYFDNCGGKSLISGAPLPSWTGQSIAIREAWRAAAHAVEKQIKETARKKREKELDKTLRK